MDGDNIRHGLSNDLGFAETDRIENIRPVAEVDKTMVDAGLIVLVTFISPFQKDREMAKSKFQEGEFIEIFFSTPYKGVKKRDPKGLYKKARASLITNMTGLSSPYQKPHAPNITIDATIIPIELITKNLIKSTLNRASS